MKITKSQLCYSCRNIHAIMDNGKPFESSIEELLDSKGYNGLGVFGYVFMNHAILRYLQDNGGCSSCIRLFELAVKS